MLLRPMVTRLIKDLFNDNRYNLKGKTKYKNNGNKRRKSLKSIRGGRERERERGRERTMRKKGIRGELDIYA